MYSTVARQAAARVGQACVSISSPFSELKKLSATALSQHWPLRPTDKGYLAVLGKISEGGRGVLAAPVGVEDHPGGGVAGGDGVGQRIGGQLGAQVISDGVADDPAGGDVDHGGHSVESELPQLSVFAVPDVDDWQLGCRWRDADLAGSGVGWRRVSASLARRALRAACPSLTAACSSSVSGMEASMRCRLSLPSSS